MIITVTREIVIIPKQIPKMTSFVYRVVPKRHGLKDRSENLQVNDDNSSWKRPFVFNLLFRVSICIPGLELEI